LFTGICISVSQSVERHSVKSEKFSQTHLFSSRQQTHVPVIMFCRLLSTFLLFTIAALHGE
jgi:hypothetical protein